MMKQQLISFISGCLFEKMSRKMYDFIQDGAEAENGWVCIPKIWFGLPYSDNILFDLKGSVKYELRTCLEETLLDLFPNYKCEIIKIVPEGAYITFDYKFSKKETVKKMTVADVEKALGYKVEIVSGEKLNGK